jgi:hypothetical protein
MPVIDTLLPLTTGSYLVVQLSSFGGLPAVIHISRKVPVSVTEEKQDRTFRTRERELGAVARKWTEFPILLSP